MLEGRKYILGESGGIVFGIERYPEVRENPDDDYTSHNGYGIAMQVHLRDAEIDPVMIFNDRQCKEMIKGMKRMRRQLRRRKRKIF